MTLDSVLIDTGSAATIVDTDAVQPIGLQPSPEDRIAIMIGIGGSELVIEKQIDVLQVGELVVKPFLIQLGGLSSYRQSFQAIVGLDFLLAANAVINFQTLTLEAG